MNEKGIDLTTMNMKLLKKIEELTLYTIDQNKVLIQQNEEIVRQNQRIEALEKKFGR
jgi:hypothetical protein